MLLIKENDPHQYNKKKNGETCIFKKTFPLIQSTFIIGIEKIKNNPTILSKISLLK
jgi:hypothetical protein